MKVPTSSIASFGESTGATCASFFYSARLLFPNPRINSLSVICLLSNLTTPNSPHGFIQIGLINCFLLCKVHSVNLTAPVTAVLIFGYNLSLGRMGAPYPLIMLPGGGDLTPGELAPPYAICIVVVFIGLYGVHLQSEEFTRTSLAATAANEMSLEVSQKS